MSKRYEVLAVNDDRDFCECCGKEGLKKVVWIRNNETDEIKHFGVICAGKPEKGFGLDIEIKTAITKHANFQKAVAYAASRIYRAKGGQYQKTGDYEWAPADSSLFLQCRDEAKKQSFNY